ncbi:hypothetical protein H5410_037457 [Solanum commersonii]|uniref:Uncharacterized protein n=1 Tax=Solanum commersonii TaxID=4109 RepID=A0A9J5Y774_SOLCO|nr:hypothetical protein H5410_037457 [Solanum commersonii]
MGKTVQAIALVELQKDSTILSSSSTTSPSVVKGTLVVYMSYDCSNAMVSPTQSKRRNRNSKHIDDDVSRRKSVLHSAHYIKSVENNITQAIFALESTYKWALTGTPLQNRIGELFSFVRFLRAYPYAYYICEDCDHRTLDFRISNKYCLCGCARYFLWWNKYIEIPLKLRSNNEERRDAMVFLKHRILEKLLLKRTKKERVSNLALSTKTVRTRRDSLDIDEYETYKSLFRRSREQLCPGWNSDEKLFSHVSYDSTPTIGTKTMLYKCLTCVESLRIRVVDHPYLVACGNKEAGDVEQACDLCRGSRWKIDESKNFEHLSISHCQPIYCMLNLQMPFTCVTSCSHVFCKACLIDFAESTERMACPSCTEPLTFEFTVNNDKGDSNFEPTGKGFSSSSISKKNQLNEFKTSTKLEALEEISIMVERDGSAKGVVFSQFTSFLDLIQRSLNLSGINRVQLVGSMSITARDAAVDKFTKDSDCRILLMSLKDGGIALDVKVVSHVFIMDTWWNPAVEQQAQDRIRRIGQHKPVKIVRFMTKNTIEEKILELQEEKKLHFEGQDSWWFFKGIRKAKREGLEIPS